MYIIRYERGTEYIKCFEKLLKRIDQLKKIGLKPTWEKL